MRRPAHQRLPEEPPCQGHVAPRPRHRAGEGDPGEEPAVAARRPADDPLRGPPRSPGRRHHFDRDPERSPRGAGRGGRSRRQAHRPREADRARRGGAGADTRRRACRGRADDRVVRVALQPVSQVRALAARVGVARRRAVRPHAVPVTRDRLVFGLELGAHPRRAAAATSSPPAATPWMRSAGARGARSCR